MYPFDPPENRKTIISYPLKSTRTCAYQGARSVRFSDVSRGVNRGYWEENT